MRHSLHKRMLIKIYALIKKKFKKAFSVSKFYNNLQVCSAILTTGEESK